MDQPQHQVFGTGKQSYRYMSYPPPKQPLQLLYPGRFMLNSYHHDGSNIPNEDPVGLQETREETAAFAHASKMEQEALARHLGGKNKVARHPPVEPEAVIEDPTLKNLSILDTSGLNPDLINLPSEYDHLRKIDSVNDETVTKYREADFNREESSMSVHHDSDNILPRYNWDKHKEYYVRDSGDNTVTVFQTCDKDTCTKITCDNNKDTCTKITCDNNKNTCSEQECDKNGDNCGKPTSCDYDQVCSNIDQNVTINTKCSAKNCTIYTCDNDNNTCSEQVCDKDKKNCQDSTTCDYGKNCSSKNKNFNWKNFYIWSGIIALIVLAILGIFILIHGIHKHKSVSNSLKPNTYAYLNPQFLPSNMKVG